MKYTTEEIIQFFIDNPDAKISEAMKKYGIGEDFAYILCKDASRKLNLTN